MKEKLVLSNESDTQQLYQALEYFYSIANITNNESIKALSKHLSLFIDETATAELEEFFDNIRASKFNGVSYINHAKTLRRITLEYPEAKEHIQQIIDNLPEELARYTKLRENHPAVNRYLEEKTTRMGPRLLQ